MSEPACKKARTTLGSLELNADRFVELMRKLIGEAKGLQNNPSQGFVPRENAASDHVLELLRPHTKEHGGPLEVERIEFTEGRGNVVIKYPGASTKSIAFVGSHMDVVPANPETWERIRRILVDLRALGIAPGLLVHPHRRLASRSTTDAH